MANRSCCRANRRRRRRRIISCVSEVIFVVEVAVSVSSTDGEEGDNSSFCRIDGVVVVEDVVFSSVLTNVVFAVAEVAGVA